jgi:hypothetical protein
MSFYLSFFFYLSLSIDLSMYLFIFLSIYLFISSSLKGQSHQILDFVLGSLKLNLFFNVWPPVVKSFYFVFPEIFLNCSYEKSYVFLLIFLLLMQYSHKKGFKSH